MNILRLLISFVLFFFLFQNLNAQKSPIKYGKISDDEIKMTIYDKDTSAEAVVIADCGEVEIVYITNIGFQLNYNRHRRIKILKKDGLNQANVSIRLYQDPSGKDENLTSLRASTYNFENGKLVETKFSKKDLFREVESKYWVLRKFALPDVKVGSVIEYDYSYSSPFFWILQDWYFQDEIPVIWSELKTTVPEWFDFKRFTGGYFSPNINEEKIYPTSIAGLNIEYKNYIKRMVYNDLPAFKSEDYITTPKDYLARVEFELRSVQFPYEPVKNYSTTWEQIGADLIKDENFGNALNRSGIVKELSEQINPSDSALKKVTDAMTLIKKQMKWDKTYGIYTTSTLRAAYNKQEGNMADINLLLVNLLRSVGVEANPVIFSTRSNGMVRPYYAMVSSFNAVLACASINGKNILLDATSDFIKPGEIPMKYINGKGLKIMENKIEWIPLLSSEQFQNSTMVSLFISEKGISGMVMKSSLSSGASNMRSEIASTGKEEYLKKFSEKNAQWEIKKHEIENLENIDKPLVERIEVNNFNQFDLSGDVIYLPAIFAEEEKNPFPDEIRLYPVDFTVPMFSKIILNLTIPEGYKVEELPKNLNLTLPDNSASFTYRANQSGQNIQVYSQLKIAKTLFLPDEYKLLKDFFNQLISKKGEQIVIRKI